MVDHEGSGEPEAPAFEDFFARVEPRLRAALTSLYGADMGHEATAEAMAWSFEHWDRVKRMEHPASYLYRVGQSRTRRLRRGRPLNLVVAPGSSTPEIDPRLAGALAELSERQRVAVLLVVGHDWSHGDVAALMSITPSTVSTHVARGLEHLRNSLEVRAHERD